MRPTQLNFDAFLELKTIDRRTISQSISSKKGTYFWFASLEALHKLGINSANNWQNQIYQENNYFLIYIGIGPRDENTRTQFLPQRIMNCHLGNKISNSTFRLSIASALSIDGFTKQVGKNVKYFINKNDEKDINDFLMKEFCVGIIYDQTPWLNEEHYINSFEPPLNLQGNSNGWFYNTMNQTRRAFLNNAKINQQ